MGVQSNARYTYEPDVVFPPGDTLADWLNDRGMTQAELATRAGLSTKHVNQMVKGAAPITTETALRLERVTGVPTHVWNNLEMSYRSHLTRLAEQERLANDAEWLEQLPVSELVKRGKIESRKGSAERVSEICAFFGVANPAAWRKMWQQPDAAYRASQAFVRDPGAVAAWLRIGEIEATNINCAPFDKSTLLNLVDELRRLTHERDPATWMPKAQVLCASTGCARRRTGDSEGRDSTVPHDGFPQARHSFRSAPGTSDMTSLGSRCFTRSGISCCTPRRTHS